MHVFTNAASVVLIELNNKQSGYLCQSSNQLHVDNYQNFQAGSGSAAKDAAPHESLEGGEVS